LLPGNGEGVVPRKSKFPPSLLHHKGSGQAYVRVQGDNHYLGKWDVVRDEATPEARAAYVRLIAALASGQPVLPKRAAPPATVADVVALWWTHEAPKLSASGRERDGYRLSLRPLLALYGPTDAVRFDAAALETLQTAMASGHWKDAAAREKLRAENGKRAANGTSPLPEGWCTGVINQRIGRIKTIWRWAERRGLVAAGSWANLRTVPGIRKNDSRARHAPRRRPATWEEVRDVARHARPPARSALLLCWWTAARPAEAYGLCPCEIDRDGDLWVYYPGRHKNAHRGQSRAIVLNRKAQAVLRPWLKGSPPADKVLFRPEVRVSDRHRAECYDDKTFSRAVRRAAVRAGRKGVTAYMLRHACKQRVTRLLGLDHARSFLGQTSLGTTNGYAEAVDLELAKEAAEKLADSRKN
jgi:integrase